MFLPEHHFLHSSRYSSYVRFDIVQRILTRLFGITVIHAMVVTDIDDKIIKRSWEVNLHIKIGIVKSAYSVM